VTDAAGDDASYIEQVKERAEELDRVLTEVRERSLSRA